MAHFIITMGRGILFLNIIRVCRSLEQIDVVDG